MKKFFSLIILVIASVSLFGQDLKVLDAEFHAGDRIKRQSFSATRTASCGPDTLLYGQAKSILADTAVAVLGLSGAVPSGGQRFEVPMGETVDLTGFTFLGFSTAEDGSDIAVRCAVYSTDANGFPTGTALAADTVQLDTAATFISDLVSYANFGSPVAITGDFVITVENISDSTLGLACTNWQVDAGQGEGVSQIFFQGNWVDAQTLAVGPAPTDNLDMDWFLEPHVSYQISAGFTSDISGCIVFDSTYTFTENHSPLVNSRFFNFLAFEAFFDPAIEDSSSNWDFGDGSPFGIGDEVSHVYAAGNNAYTVKNYALVLGYSTFCLDSAEQTFDAVAAPVADFTFTIDTANMIVNFTNASSGGETFSWSFGDGNSSTDENPSNVYATADSFTVTLTVSSCAGSLISTSTQGFNLTQMNVSRADELLESMALFPNPTTNFAQLNLELNQTSEVKVRLTNMIGQELTQMDLGRVRAAQVELDLSAQQPGIYLLAIEIDGETIVRKVQRN